MDQFYKKYEDDRRAIELENTKLKLRMVSRNSKTSKPSVDDYINNILGSGLKFNQSSNHIKYEFQSAKNVHYNDHVHTQKNLNQSCNFQPYIQNGNGCQTEHSVKLPPLYGDVIDAVRLSTSELDTSTIYNIFITSGLSQDILGQIWSMINRTSPGQLTEQELVVGLATIALCQEQLASQGSQVSVRLPSWDQVVSLVNHPVPNIIIHRPTPDTTVISQHVTSHPAESNDEWADFSEFISSTKNPEYSVVNKVDKCAVLSSNDLNGLTEVPSMTCKPTVEHPVVDIGEEINNQFTNWRDNIHLEKLSTPNQSDLHNVPQNYTSLLTHPVNTGPDIEKRKSTESVLPTVTDADFGDFQLFASIRPQSALDERGSKSRDRYEIFNCDIKAPNDSLIEQWLRCLAQCLRILSNTVNVLKQIQDDMIKLDVFSTEKGILLLKGIIEVYRVTRNIKLSASRLNILTSSKPMLDHLSDLEHQWNEFMLVIPDDMQIDVQSKLCRSGQDPSTTDGSGDDLSLNDYCGVCLCKLDHDEGFLGHGLHRYHCPCANLWVNTLDLTLPGLSMSRSGSVLS